MRGKRPFTALSCKQPPKPHPSPPVLHPPTHPSTGSWAIRATPGGMRYMTWSGGWGNLRYANNAALVALAWAAQQPAGAVGGVGA